MLYFHVCWQGAANCSIISSGGVWLDRSNIITWVFLYAGYVHRSCLAMDLFCKKKRGTHLKWFNPTLVSRGKIPLVELHTRFRSVREQGCHCENEL